MTSTKTTTSCPFDDLTPEELRRAAKRRVSQRAYADLPVDQGAIDALRSCVDAANACEACLDFQLYGPLDNAGRAVGIASRMFAGTFHWYAALVCDDDDVSLEKCGYYGERLVLLASHLGLGTCWVAGTFNRAITRAEVGKGRVLLAIVPIGHAMEKTPFAQRMIRKSVRRSTKLPGQTVESDVPYEALPEWVRAGAEAIIAGPSAVNQEPVVLMWDGAGLSARYEPTRRPREVTIADFGIAKLHFECLCGMPGRWEWGQGGAYRPSCP